MDISTDIKNKISLMAENYKTSELILAAKKLSESYLNNDHKNNSFVNSKIDALTYAIMRMPATSSAIKSSLSILSTKTLEPVGTILDIGAGTGASILAISELISAPYTITCLEREKVMIDLSKEIYSDFKNVTYKQCDFVNDEIKDKADLVIASYFINELNDNARVNALNKMIETTNKYLLIVEPGTPESFVRMRETRNYLISQGLNIVAPCPHMDKCPILNDDWCHFTVRVARSRLHKLLKRGNAPYEDEKFTYLLFSKTKVDTCKNRVLRHPLIQNGFVKLKLCNNNGKINEEVITKKNKEQYKIARKVKAGDTF